MSLFPSTGFWAVGFPQSFPEFSPPLQVQCFLPPGQLEAPWPRTSHSEPTWSGPARPSHLPPPPPRLFRPCQGPLLRERQTSSSFTPPDTPPVRPTQGSHSFLASGLRTHPSTATWIGGQHGRRLAPTTPPGQEGRLHPPLGTWW